MGNVSKGEVAKKADLLKCFEEVKGDQKEICKIILAKGDLQVSEKERQAQQDAMFKDIATVISDKCVNPETKRPYPVSMIEKAMKECHIAVKPNKGAKQQALEIVPKLREKLPLSRAQMRLKIVVPLKEFKKLNQKLTKMKLTKESEEQSEENTTVIYLVDPGEYRNLDEIVKKDTQGRGQLEILSLKEVDDSEQQLGT